MVLELLPSMVDGLAHYAEKVGDTQHQPSSLGRTKYSSCIMLILIFSLLEEQRCERIWLSPNLVQGSFCKISATCSLLPQQWILGPATQVGRLVACIQILLRQLQWGLPSANHYDVSLCPYLCRGGLSHHVTCSADYSFPKLKKNPFFKVWFFP